MDAGRERTRREGARIEAGLLGLWRRRLLRRWRMLRRRRSIGREGARRRRAKAGVEAGVACSWLALKGRVRLLLGRRRKAAGRRSHMRRRVGGLPPSLRGVGARWRRAIRSLLRRLASRIVG